MDTTTWVGTLLSVVVGLVIYTWVTHEGKVRRLEEAHHKLERAILEDYWDKIDTQNHIDLVLRPVIQSLDNVAEELRNLTRTLANTHKH